MYREHLICRSLSALKLYLMVKKAGKEMLKDRVAIVGVGNVGATTAYALLVSGLAPDMVLINRDRNKAEGEAEDISHAEPWSHTTLVRAAGFGDCATAKVIVVTVGAGLKPGETRLDLLKKNAAIFRDLIPKIASTNPQGILLIATNPVDALTSTRGPGPPANGKVHAIAR
jgi:L-lactate dehydrogenase